MSVSTHPTTRSTDTLRADLVRAAAMRRAQLLQLPTHRADDVVASEHRASVQRIHDDIRAALDRMDAGTFGACTGCGTRMPVERLVDRPWVARCEPCTARAR